MAIRTIVTEGDPILGKTCREVTAFDERLHTLLDDMLQTMRKHDGVGLAANQVGLLKRVVIIEVDHKVYELINPEVLKTSGEQTGAEGCLSFPGQYGIVTRPNKVTVRALDRNGKPYKVTGEGLLARALMHETDHLNGIVFKSYCDHILTPEELENLGR